MSYPLFRLDSTLPRDPAIDAWFDARPGPLGDLARAWFQHLRSRGDEVREILHDGCPVACLGDAPFASVNLFTAHVNLAFFHGASFPDPARLLHGAGKYMRHVKLRPTQPIDAAPLHALIAAAWTDIKSRVEHG